MQSHSQIQALFLQWHKHHGICSIEQIRTACSNLMKSFNLEPDHSLFKVFFPLVRKGFIEFSGDGKYQVSQPMVLFYKKEQIAVGINQTIEQRRVMESQFELINIDDFKVIRFKSEHNKVKLFCKACNCEYSEPNITEILSNFPKISDVVEKFEPAMISSSGEFLDVSTHHWRKNKNQNVGVFRLTEDSHKFYLRTKQRDFQIPDLLTNPEGRPLAECFQATVENQEFLFYQKADKTLMIKHINIPILVERVLRMASLTSENGVKEEYGKTTYQNIPLSTISQLNRIFGIKTIIKA